MISATSGSGTEPADLGHPGSRLADSLTSSRPAHHPTTHPTCFPRGSSVPELEGQKSRVWIFFVSETGGHEVQTLD